MKKGSDNVQVGRRYEPINEMAKPFLALFAVFLVICLIPSIHTAGLDIRKTYDDKTATVTLSSAVLAQDVYVAKLITPHDNRVIRGKDVQVAEINITSLNKLAVSTEDVFGKMAFTDLKAGKQINKVFTYKVKIVSGTKDEPIVTKEVIGSNVSYYISGYRKVTNYEWKEVKSFSDIPNGEVTIGVFTEVLPNEHVEWIPNIFGVDITEWAAWSESLQAELKHYYKMNESTNVTLYDSLSTNNGTFTNSAPGYSMLRPGISGTAIQSPGAGNFITLTQNNYDTDFNFTYAFWINTTSSLSGLMNIIGERNGDATGNVIFWYALNASGNIVFQVQDNVGGTLTLTGKKVNNGSWHYIAYTGNTTSVCMYADAELQACGPKPGGAMLALINMYIGKISSGTPGNYGGDMDEFGIWNRTLTAAEVVSLYNGGAGLTYNNDTIVVVPSGITVSLQYPTGGLKSNKTTLNFNASITPTGDNLTLYNFTVSVWNGASSLFAREVNTTINTTTQANISIPIGSLVTGNYIWNTYACGYNLTGTLCSYATNITFEIDTTPPTITLESPNGTLFTQNIPYNITLSAVSTDTNLQTCWYSSTTNTTPTAYTCNSPTLVRIASDGYYNLTVGANDSTGNGYSTTSQFFLNKWNSSAFIANPSTEGDTQTYYLNLTATKLTNATARVVFGGLSYNLDELTSNGTFKTFSVNVTVPEVTTTDNFVFDNTTAFFQMNSEFNSTKNTSLQIYNEKFQFCNSTVNKTYLNFTFQDESDFSTLNATLDFFSVSYVASGKSNTHTYSFSNTSGLNYAYAFCYYPPHETISATTSVKYASPGFPQRTFDDVFTLTNSTTNKILYLLGTTDGLYVTFQTTTGVGNQITGVFISVNRTDIGFIGSQFTDESGTATFWLNPNFPHIVTASKAGYDTVTLSITPSQSQYTIVLGGQSVTNTVVDSTKGIAWDIKPASRYLLNDTTYQFNLTLSSDFYSLDSWGMNISNDTAYLCANSSTVATGGTLSCDAFTGKSEFMNFTIFWEINGTVYTDPFKYKVVDNEGSQFSITRFFDDLKNYINDAGGFFGLTPASMKIIIFIVMFGLAGIFSYKFGVTSPEGVWAIFLVVGAIATSLALGLAPGVVYVIFMLVVAFAYSRMNT